MTERSHRPTAECQYHNQCGGWCETEEEQEQCLCGDCLQAEREEDAEQQHAVELGKAMQRIACAAGIDLAQPGEIADIVCARLIANLVPPNGEKRPKMGTVEMQTKQQIGQAFRAELQALLDKYGAKLEGKLIAFYKAAQAEAFEAAALIVDNTEIIEGFFGVQGYSTLSAASDKIREMAKEMK